MLTRLNITGLLLDDPNGILKLEVGDTLCLDENP